MDDEKDKNYRNPDASDIDLWRSATKDVQLLPGREYLEQGDSDTDPDELSVRETIAPAVRASKKTTGGQSSQIDRRTDTRLRRGQILIEARIDLHGFNRHDAEDALKKFILKSYRLGQRCVLVITGKGRSSPGVLRQNVPYWLSEGDLESLVLKSYPAKAKDGGEGAFYVYLRRQR